MAAPEALTLALEDVLAELWHARRIGDLGRLALLVHFDLRRWAVAANQASLAKDARELVLSCPQSSRAEYLAKIDMLIRQAEQLHQTYAIGPHCVGHPQGTCGHAASSFFVAPLTTASEPSSTATDLH